MQGLLNRRVELMRDNEYPKRVRIDSLTLETMRSMCRLTWTFVEEEHKHDRQLTASATPHRIVLPPATVVAKRYALH
jgi:hypothetical protein